MKNNNVLIIGLLFFSSFFILFIIYKLHIKPDIQRKNNKELKEIGIKLQDCIDIKNKNKRSIYDSNELIEFCVSKYGIDQLKIK